MYLSLPFFFVYTIIYTVVFLIVCTICIYNPLANRQLMTSIISTKHVQQNLGEISSSIGEKCFIVTNYGRGHIVMLPYFDGCDECIAEYMEDYLMYKNKEALQKRYKKSLDSGKGGLRI